MRLTFKHLDDMCEKIDSCPEDIKCLHDYINKKECVKSISMFIVELINIKNKIDIYSNKEIELVKKEFEILVNG
jgi:hypothetical protein